MDIKKMIYFPMAWGNKAGTLPNHPLIIFVEGKPRSSGEYHGSRMKEELESGRRGGYIASRTIEFSESAWEICQGYIERKLSVEAEYKKLQRLANKQPKGNRLF